MSTTVPTLGATTSLTPPVSKRRAIDSLPVTNQTPDLAAFFGASVDQVFQPGRSEAINAYIGRPIPNNADFYVPEPTRERKFYQLEAGMVSRDADNQQTINHTLTYPDLVSFLAVSGANTTNHDRMFETDYYTWAPPINIDMLVNYRYYYWFGDVDPEAQTLYVFNKSDRSNAVVLSNSNLTALSQAATGMPAAVRTTPIGSGLWYVEFTVVTRNGAQFVGVANQTDALNPGLPGQQSGNNAVIYADTGHVYNDNGMTPAQSGLTAFTAGDVIGMAWSTFSKKVWFRVNGQAWDGADNPTTASGGYDLTSLLANGPVCLLWAGTGNNDQISVNLGNQTFKYAPPPGFVGPTSTLPSEDLPTLTLHTPLVLYPGDGVSTVFGLPEPIRCCPTSYERPTAYVNNVIVSGTHVSGDGLSIVLPYPPPASTPGNPVVVMVSRTPDLAAIIAGGVPGVDVSDLNSEGVTHLSSGMRINIVDTSHLADAWDTQPWDHDPVPADWQPGANNVDPNIGWDATNDAVYMVDGVGQEVRLTAMSNMVRGMAAQYVTIDRSSRDGNPWSVRNSWVHKDTFAWSGQNFPTRQATRPIIEFIRDIVLYPAQTWSEGADPLFMLYDLQHHALNDSSPTGRYPNSTFVGNRLFGFAQGTGGIDSVLRRPLVYDSNGYIVFSNDAANVNASYEKGSPAVSTPISGLMCYGIYSGSLQYVPFWHQAANTTVQGQTNGLWNIPVNLQANPDHQEVATITRAQWASHFNSMIVNQPGYVGNTSGKTNYRDTSRDLSLGTGILQHHAPLLKTMLLAAGFDLLPAIQYAELEYSRFRNKFARKLVDMHNKGVLTDDDAPAAWVAAALDALKVGHNNSFPFALSGMAGGQYFIPPTPTGLCIQPSAVPAIITDDTYGAEQSMLLGHDGSLSFLFNDWRDDILLELETVIYENLPQPPTTVQNRIAPGVGSFFSSNGHLFSISSGGYILENGNVVPGGAGTSAMQFYNGQVYAQDAASGRWYIYSAPTFTYVAVPPPVNPEAGSAFDIQRWIGGRFYQPYQGYTWQEVNAIMAPMFELWAQLNRVDFRSNTTFDAADPFTWNYRGVQDHSGHPLPGHWRAIYRYYYDTDAPHLRPWEMLGFTSEPAWWESRYGAAPYTRRNTQLWLDLEAGLVAAGPRAGANPRYARPGLHDVVPVDFDGKLLNPIQAGIVLTNVTLDMAQRSWIPGDGAPAEALWQHSPSYRFALARASFLMKPARLVEQCWDLLNIGYINGQWVERATLLRPRNAQQYVHGEPDQSLTPPTVAAKVGISQWLADYMTSNGRSSASLGAAVRGLDVALIHQMAGFTSADQVELVADAFGVLPSEDVKTVLYTSPPTAAETYSGVIVQWTGRSWSVLGFDGRSQKFTTIPPNPTGPRGIISLASASEPSIVAWRQGTYYPTGILAEYQNSVYECTRSHTAGANFELLFWRARPDISTATMRAPRVVTYNNGLGYTASVPYGTEFFTYQDLADFLLGYERYLVSRGWVFNQVNQDNEVLDWKLAVREFLTWAQVQWAPGNFIALSPGQAQLHFAAQQGTILNVEDNLTGFFGLIDRNGAPISQRQAIVSRLDGTITIAANGADIFLARLQLCNTEHALIPNNVTVFDDDVYLPLFNMRVQRLRLITNRPYGWAGRLDAPGFVISDNLLKSNFEKTADDVRLMFDIEQADVQVLRDYARHNVGMQTRRYLSNLLLSDNEQFEFYQGMVQEKGTPGVFQALARSSLATGNTTLQFLEEWAFRVCAFGAPRDAFLTFQLAQSAVRSDPQIVRFIRQPATPPDWIELSTQDARWIDQPKNPTKFFPERGDYAPPALPTAGPVRLSEVDGTCFDITQVPAQYNANSFNMPAGTRLWVYNSTPIFDGTAWYVSAANGNDNNTGLSPTSALATLQQAHDQANPGDVIYVAGGTYTGLGLGNTVLEITRSGSPSAPITFQALAGTGRPIIMGSQSAAAVHFNAVAYVVFDGFEVIGWNSGLILSDVQAEARFASLMTSLNGSGIVIDQGGSSTLPHHITIRNCSVHDFPYNGIYASYADYVTIDQCTVYSNGLYSGYAGSGINIANSHAIDNVSTYKTIVTRNICYDNINLVLDASQGSITGGCGISIKGNLNDHTDGIAYTGRTLVQNNLVYNNGGVGIQVFDSQHADVTFNTAYRNQTNTNMAFGEICVQRSIDGNVFNNIMVASPNAQIAGSLLSNAVTFSNNLGYGGAGVSPMPGVALMSDPLFVDPTYTRNFRLRQGSWALKSANRQFSADVDLAGDARTPDSGWDIGCYQRESAPPPDTGSHPYTVLRADDIGVVPNAVLSVLTAREDTNVTTMRVVFQQPMTVFSSDVGNYLIIDGPTKSSPELQGVQLITAVHPDLNAVDILTVGTAGHDFLNDLQNGPACRVLRPLRFASIAAINPYLRFQPGDLVWIDHYTTYQWAVLQWDGSEWTEYRLQPRRINPTTISETVIYSAGASLRGQQLVLNRPTVPDVMVIDPLSNLICALCARDIDYQTEVDPARYNAGAAVSTGSTWGRNELGRVWWDLSTVRFIDPYTDTLGLNPARDLAELQYRLSHWASIAPNSSVDVYEWIESTQLPSAYAADPTMPGTVYNAGATWVQRSVRDPTSGEDVTRYYFWVKGLTVVPNIASRHTSVSDIALGIGSPSALGVAWMSAISTDALLVSGVADELDETTTVMKVRLSPADTVGQHDEWQLMRSGDPTSLPSDTLWGKVRDGLAGFEVAAASLLTIPDPDLTLTRSIGIDAGQSVFTVGTALINPWRGGTTYYYGDLVANNGLAYQCVSEGVSAGLPYLRLNNDQTATYTSGSGTHLLVFTYDGLYVGGLAAKELALNTASVVNVFGQSVTLADATVQVSSPLSTQVTFTLIFPLAVTVETGDGPGGYSDTIYDGSAVWAYYGVDSSRAGLLDARAAFVGNVNEILARTAIQIERSTLLQNLYRTTPYPSADAPYLVWGQIDASHPYEPPPANEWDAPWQVYSLTERNDLLATDAFLSAIYANKPIDVLLTGFANALPQWSIWRMDPAAAQRVIHANSNLNAATALVTNAGVVFGLKTAYEYSVATEADRNALTGLRNGDRVLVTDDTDGFWAIWRWYDPYGIGGYFDLWRVQTYNTADFIESADWYDTATLRAHGFDAGPTNPPVITYATTRARDAAEGYNPTNLLVKVLNTDTAAQNFTWTAWIDAQWRTVAIENATVQLSANVCDPRRPTHAVSTSASPSAVTLSDVGLRDGSWELYILAHALRYSGILTDLEINELWFDMVNFVHVQQNEVDWAFKTSFMTLAGIAAPMAASAVQMLDQTSDVIAYINEVKPYRVKLRETTSQYVPPFDVATLSVTDFDAPVYTDPATGRQRGLDPLNPDDAAILSRPTDPWSQWYANYDLTPSPVRSITVSLSFDRVVGDTGNWDMQPWDVWAWDDSEADPGAAYRINTFYAPTAGMPPLDVSALLGLDAKEDQISSALVPAPTAVADDGGSFTASNPAVDINPPQTSRPGGFDLRAPYYAAQHPEERIVFDADDQILIHVTADPLPGAPPQLVKVFDLDDTARAEPTITLFLDMVPHSSDAVLVYCDGVRAVRGTDYSVDYLNRAIVLNVTVNGSPVRRVVTHVFSFGGAAEVTEQHFLTYGTDPLTLNAPTGPDHLMVLVNGDPVDGSQLSVDGVNVSLASPPANGADIALAVYADVAASTACQTRVQTLSYGASRVFTLQYPDVETVPAHAGTIVELNGRRLTPPMTFYGRMSVGVPWMYLPLMPDVTSQVSVWVDDTLYTAPIPIAIGTSDSSSYPFGILLPGAAPNTGTRGQFALYNNLLISLDPTFISDNIKVSVIFANDPPDYTLSQDGGTLTVNAAMTGGDQVTVTTFTHARCMGIQTIAYTVGEAEQHVIPAPFGESYCLVWLNGLALVQEDDYSISPQNFETSDGAYFTADVIQLIDPDAAGDVVVTSFTAQAAREVMEWLYCSTTPAASRMYPAPIPPAQLKKVGWDATNWDSQKYDDATLLGVSANAPANPKAVFAIDGRFEHVRLSPYMAGILAADVAPDDATITVNLFARPIAAKMQDDNPLPIPSVAKDRPGVVYIEGERIEYFSYSRDGDVVTLGVLRRATRGTSMGAKRLVQAATGTGLPQSFTFGAAGAADVEIEGVGQPASTFTSSLGSGGGPETTVTLTAPAGAHVVVGLSITASHLAGTEVYNGAHIFQEDVPLGPLVGNREVQPMARLIHG